jgi:hypothetical protein
MKLSEAILLGSTVVTPKAGALQFGSESAGCALGMAVIGCGGSFVRGRRRVRMEDRRTLNVESIFGIWLLRVVMRPCDCREYLTFRDLRIKKIAEYFFSPGPAMPRAMRVKDIIAHLFDYHVMEKKNWTLDQLAAWVATFEPSELAQSTMAAHAARRAEPKAKLSYSPEEAAEWRETREAFEAKLHTKRLGSRIH